MQHFFGLKDGFDLFSLAFQGFFQFGFALGGAVFLLLGLAIIYDHFSWRTGASKYRTHGDIIGIRVKGQSFRQDEGEEEAKEKEAEKLKALKQATSTARSFLLVLALTKPMNITTYKSMA